MVATWYASRSVHSAFSKDVFRKVISVRQYVVPNKGKFVTSESELNPRVGAVFMMFDLP